MSQQNHLLNPTSYHLQQLRYHKESIGMKIPQEQPFMLVKRESPSLSDMDYSDFNRQHFFFDGTLKHQPSAIEMKRSSTDASMNMQEQPYYYPFEEQQNNNTTRMMAGSAPSTIGFHYSPFAAPPDDIISTTSSTNMISSSHEMNTEDDYSTQAK